MTVFIKEDVNNNGFYLQAVAKSEVEDKDEDKTAEPPSSDNEERTNKLQETVDSLEVMLRQRKQALAETSGQRIEPLAETTAQCIEPFAETSGQRIEHLEQNSIQQKEPFSETSIQRKEPLAEDLAETRSLAMSSPQTVIERKVAIWDAHFHSIVILYKKEDSKMNFFKD